MTQKFTPTPTNIGIILIIICLIISIFLFVSLQKKASAVIESIKTPTLASVTGSSSGNNRTHVPTVEALQEPPQATSSTPTLARNPTRVEVDDYIGYMVTYYQAKPEIVDLAKKVVHCESNYRQYKKDGTILLGSAGEKGIAQFKQATFNLFKGYYGQLNLEIDSWQDQIRLMVIMLSEGQKKHWSCS